MKSEKGRMKNEEISPRRRDAKNAEGYE